MQNAFFLIFLTELFGHVKKKQYLCKLFRAKRPSYAYIRVIKTREQRRGSVEYLS